MSEELAFVKHWHSAAQISEPRFVPDSWLRQASVLIGKGVTLEDLTLVAKWMRTQLGRSQQGERNSVAFNAASFPWVKMFGQYGASDQHERFVSLLSLAEAARPRGSVPVQQPCTRSARSLPSEAEQARVREVNARAMDDFQNKMQGGQG